MGAKVRFFDGAWYVFVNHRRQRKAKKIGTGPEAKRLAEQVARTIEAKLALGDVGIFAEREEVTLRAYVEEWLEGYVRNNLKGGTLRIYRGVMENHWLPALGDVPIGDLTRQDIRRVVTDKIRQGLTASRRPRPADRPTVLPAHRRGGGGDCQKPTAPIRALALAGQARPRHGPEAPGGNPHPPRA